MNLLIDTQVVRYDLGGGLRYINGMLSSILKLNNKFKIYVRLVVYMFFSYTKDTLFSSVLHFVIELG